MRKHVSLVLALALWFPGGGLAAEQSVDRPAAAAGVAASPVASTSRPLAHAGGGFDVAITRAMDKFARQPDAGTVPFYAASLMSLEQRTRTRPQGNRRGSGGSEAWKWVGVGMMVIGGLWVIVGLAWCGVGAVCARPLVVGGVMAGGGWYVFNNNR